MTALLSFGQAGYFLPRLSRFDHANVALRDPVVTGDQAMTTGVVVYFKYSFWLNLGKVVLGTALSALTHRRSMLFSWCRTAAHHHVCRVFSGAPPTKMIWPHARWIVARVQSKLSHPWMLACKNERDSMGEDRYSSIADLAGKSAVPAPIFVSGPNPAMIGYRNLLPKSSFEAIGQGRYNSTIHGAVPSRFGQGRALLQAAFPARFCSRFTVYSQGYAR